MEPCETAIHGQSFARAAVVENLAAGYPPRSRGCSTWGSCHRGHGREGHEPYAPCTLDDLRARRYDYWALGHVHKRETLAADPPIVFPGNLQGRHVRESGPKGCMLVTVDDRHRARAEPVSLDVFRWEVCQLDPAAFETGYDLLDSVRQGLAELAAKADDRPLAVRVQVSGPSPAHRTLTAEPQRWTNEIRAVAQDLGGREVWIEKVELRTTPPAENSLGNVMDGPVGELIQWIAELKSDPARLTSLGDELAEFRDRLPMELKRGHVAGPGTSGTNRPVAGPGGADPGAPASFQGGRGVRILKFDLRAFGPFSEVCLDLSGGHEGLHVIYGPNEAGKSSALRALVTVFGIPRV